MQKRLTITGYAQTIILGVVSIASIVTPLGLYDSIEPGPTTPEPFAYIKGTSAFSYGTPSRSDAPFTRNCGLQQACPGTSLNETCHQQGLLENCTVVYDSLVPEHLVSIFRDGASAFAPSVSSIFDMQYRTFINGTDPYSVLGWYAKPSYRSLQVLILDEKVEAVEGLIVDMVDGGIGFRNHTAPSKALKYGSTWDEDILFIQPETQCVPLNMSIDFQLPSDLETSLSVVNLVLKDHGVLSGLAQPRPSISVPVNGQEFDLRQRARNAAWYNNFLTLAYLNATDPDPTNITRLDVTPGQTFRPETSNFTIGYSSIWTTISLGEYLNLRVSNSTVNSHNITQKDFDLATSLCGGTTSSSPSTINSALIGCGLVYGAANRTDGVSPLRTDPNSPWSIPLYICASAVKASLKTVSFRYNGTGLDALAITSLSPKNYTSPPLWAVEDLPNRTLSEVQPLWGILPANTTSPSYRGTDISTIAAPSLYLPGYIDTTTPLTGYLPVPVSTGQNLPGVDFYTQALYRALSISTPAGQPYADYSGWTSLTLYAKWQALSASAGGVAKMINLIWTDFAANAMVGTKSLAGQTRPVTVYERRIRYRLPYAVPAIVVLVASLGIVGSVVVLGCMRRTGIRRLRGFLEKTALGRVLSAGLAEDDEGDWVEKVGGKRVRITDGKITVEGGLLSGETQKEGDENDSAEAGLLCSQPKRDGDEDDSAEAEAEVAR